MAVLFWRSRLRGWLGQERLTLLTQTPMRTPLSRKWHTTFMHRTLPGLVGYWSASQLLSTAETQVRGPYMVQRNLISGLAQIGCPFYLNPDESNITADVGVLFDVAALRWAIQAKRAGKIRLLVAGPNLVVTPLDADRVLCAPEIDIVVTPSLWVSQYYASVEPDLRHKLREWPVGIDTRYWKPAANKKPHRPNWLVYDKTRDMDGQAVKTAVLAELARRKFSYKVLTYGNYQQREYREALQNAMGMIVLSASESQGIAQFEAWAYDVPTLVWDRRVWMYQGIVFEHPSVSSSPYLTSACGMRFCGFDDFAECLDQFVNRIDTFTPRDYVVSKFTLPKAARQYADLFKAKLN